ncbi:MAG: hypothetical protein Q8K81_06660 [Sulfuricurvum sp.]|nr:hypothetical protein [Sulfuricurvum sp.]
MKTALLILCTASILMGAGGDVSEVGKLGQQYEECTSSRKDLETKVKGYQTRIASLEAQIAQNSSMLTSVKKNSNALAHEIGQKKGVIKSLEQTLIVRDRAYRETSARNKNITAQLHTQKVSGQEREMLKRALVSAKGELALAQKELRGGSSQAVKMREELKAAKAALATLQSAPSKIHVSEKIVTKVVEPTEKIRALQTQLNSANLAIAQLRSSPSKVQQPQIVTKVVESTPKVVYKDRIVTQEKVVYKDRPVEKVVIKTVEPTAKVQALTRELSSAKTTIANLKNSGAKVVYKDRIVTQEKVVYKDRLVEKVVIKTVEPTAKVQALTRELSSAKTTIANLKNSGAKVVYKDRIVTQEKVVYKDRPVEKVVIKTVIQEKPTMDENARRQIDKLSLELERAKTLNLKLSRDLAKGAIKHSTTATLAPLPATKPVLRSAAKTVTPPALKSAAPAAVHTSSSSKKSSGVYRMASNASIYNGPNGRVIDTWEARRSFTAGNPSDGWIHITGYFVNRVFQAASDEENLWVRESDTIRR